MRRNVSFSLTRLGVTAVLLGGLALPGTARAQDDVTLSMARERFKEGVAYFDKKDFAKARVAFLQAYALKKHPAVLLNLAQSELRSGHEAEAAKHFAQYLREHKDATEAERQGAEAGLTASKALVAEVTIDVDTVGAEVYVDGDLEGQSPLPGPIYLMPGDHQIEARMDGKKASAQVAAAAGQANSLKLGVSRPAKTPTAAGSEAPQVAESEEASESVATDRETSSRQGFFPWLTHTPGAMVGAGLTGVGLIGGGVMAINTKLAYDAAKSVEDGILQRANQVDLLNDPSVRPCTNPNDWLKNHSDNPAYQDDALRAKEVAQFEKNCNKYLDNVKAGDTYKKLAIVGFAVAGAAALGTIIYYIVDTKPVEKSASQSRVRLMVLPLYQPGFAGGMVSGAF